MEAIKEQYAKEIKDEFYKEYAEYYCAEDNDFDTFKEEYIHTTYNSGMFREYKKTYEDLLCFMKIIKEHHGDDEVFPYWDKPEKIYELGMCILADETLSNIKQIDMPLRLADIEQIFKNADEIDLNNEHLKAYYWEEVFPALEEAKKEEEAKEKEEKEAKEKEEGMRNIREIRKLWNEEIRMKDEHNEKSIMYEKLMMEERKKMATPNIIIWKGKKQLDCSFSEHKRINECKERMKEYQLKLLEENKKFEEHNENRLKHEAKLKELVERYKISMSMLNEWTPILHKEYGVVSTNLAV